MAQITAALVKELREKSGAGMMDCKKALGENDGNIEASMDWLRTKGLAAAAKKSSRTAADGLVAVCVEGNKGVVAEINAETDFVARNGDFQAFVSTTAAIALANDGDVEASLASAYPETGRTLEEQLSHNVATIGENMSFRRAETLSVENGVVVSYVHSAVVDGLGKIGVLIALESTADTAVLQGLGKQLAMHVAATNPASLSTDDLDPALVERERQVQIDKARESGKPDEIIMKMIDGRMRKYYEEVVLLNQAFVMDPDNKVSKVIEAAAKDAGTDITLKAFVRFELGDGIEVEEDDFAAEVASMTSS